MHLKCSEQGLAQSVLHGRELLSLLLMMVLKRTAIH